MKKNRVGRNENRNGNRVFTQLLLCGFCGWLMVHVLNDWLSEFGVNFNANLNATLDVDFVMGWRGEFRCEFGGDLLVNFW